MEIPNIEVTQVFTIPDYSKYGDKHLMDALAGMVLKMATLQGNNEDVDIDEMIKMFVEFKHLTSEIEKRDLNQDRPKKENRFQKKMREMMNQAEQQKLKKIIDKTRYDSEDIFALMEKMKLDTYQVKTLVECGENNGLDLWELGSYADKLLNESKS